MKKIKNFIFIPKNSIENDHFTLFSCNLELKITQKYFRLSEKLHNLPFSTMSYKIQSFKKKFEKFFENRLLGNVV